MTLHTFTPNQCPYQVSTSYTLRFLSYSPDKVFPADRQPERPPAHPNTMGENNTQTGLWDKNELDYVSKNDFKYS